MRSFPRASVREVRDEIFRIENGSQIEQKTVVVDSPDDRRMASAKALRDGVGAQLLVLDGNDQGRQLFGRKRAAADLRRAILQACAESLAEDGLDFGQRLLARGAVLGQRTREGFERRNGLRDIGGLPVKSQGRLERC